MPKLKHWNYEACEQHKDIGPQVACPSQACGGDFFSHQRVAIMWLYTIQKGLLADDPGVGKTNSILGLIAFLKEKNKLSKRAVIVPQTPAVGQWGKELARWTTGLKAITVDGSIPRKKREEIYSQNWDVLIIGSHVAINDKDLLNKIAPFDLVVTDDVDPLLSHNNATHRALVNISQDAKYSFTVNATVLQVRLQQLHAALVPAGGLDVFGSLPAFEARYVRTENVPQWVNGKKKTYRTQTGYKRVPELRELVRPQYLKRKATELSDIRMPMLMPPEIKWFDMSIFQREKYDELQQGVLTLLREEGSSVKHVNALTKFMYGQQICAGLPALNEPDGSGASPKLDWLFHQLNTVWTDRKVIVFVKNVGMVKAAIARANRDNIGMAMIWGQNQNSQQREEQKIKFRDDPNCRFMIGTTSLERSHNLQTANTVVALDTHLNWARMVQILGRAKRAGSPHDRVFFFKLLTKNSQEEGYEQVLSERQAVNDAVFEMVGELYDTLTPMQLLNLIGTTH